MTPASWARRQWSKWPACTALASLGVPSHKDAELGVDFALADEVDLSCADVFATTLERIVPLASGPELVAEGRGLTVIDHRRLLVFADRLIKVLEVAGMRVESLA